MNHLTANRSGHFERHFDALASQQLFTFAGAPCSSVPGLPTELARVIANGPKQALSAQEAACGSDYVNPFQQLERVRSSIFARGLGGSNHEIPGLGGGAVGHGAPEEARTPMPSVLVEQESIANVRPMEGSKTVRSNIGHASLVSGFLALPTALFSSKNGPNLTFLIGHKYDRSSDKNELWRNAFVTFNPRLGGCNGWVPDRRTRGLAAWTPLLLNSNVSVGSPKCPTDNHLGAN